MKDYEEFISETIENATDNIRTQLNRAYMYGHEQGKKVSCNKEEMEAEYNRGLNEAWEVIQNIANDDTKGGYSYKMMMDIFGVYRTYDIVQKYAPQDVIRMIKEYEQQKQDTEIKVGDEVYNLDRNNPRVVTSISNNGSAIQVTGNGKMAVNNVKELHKTGRTFPQIAEVLKEMRGEE